MAETNPNTFLGIAPPDPLHVAAAIIPVPYDLTSTWRKGADRGPAAIIEASGAVELYDIQTAGEPWRHGIRTLPPVLCDGPPTEMAELVRAQVGAVLDAGQLAVVLGGEHSVTIGAVEAARDRHDDLSVLQIDAHADTRESYEGSTHNHACVMARARERCSIVQVGIRSMDAEEVPRLDRERVFFAHDIVGNPDRSWMDRAIDLLSETVYMTIDLDAFDPSVLPATGTPEPGGLTWWEVDEFLQRLTKRRRLVAFDVVELLPMEAHHGSAFTAAKLVYRILGMVLGSQGRGARHLSS